ncbi:DNA-binding GntR family transcriptional regulator [Bradyrhizobium sp. LM2.7]
MLHEEVVGRIRAILLEGEIPPGARIPERELCDRLQISRTPLREALKVLAAEGLVHLLPHRGSRAAKLTDKDMRDLFEVCQGLEALAGELACERITEAEIDEIAAAHASMVQHYREGDLIQYYRGNRAIHEAIVAAARKSRALGALCLRDRAHSPRALRHADEPATLGVRGQRARSDSERATEARWRWPFPHLARTSPAQARRGLASRICGDGRERARAEDRVRERSQRL